MNDILFNSGILPQFLIEDYFVALNSNTLLRQF